MGTTARPMPADFADFAYAMGEKLLARKYKTGIPAIQRWRAEIGPDPRAPRIPPVPADLAEMAKTMKQAELARHYGVDKHRVKKWITKAGVTPLRRKTLKNGELRPAPKDFAATGPTMIRKELMAHYRCNHDTLARWIAETKVWPKVWEAPRKDPAPVAYRQPVTFRNNPRALIHRDIRQTDMYDDAADVIRRERFAVYRCNERGVYDPKGASWRVGISILTPDELLQRADKYRRRAA